jgi:hypothetical protein
MLAIATGINGLYIFLSAGLGGFIVSGLLSERLMKICKVKRVHEKITQSGESFSLSFELSNYSKSTAAHAIKICFLQNRPRFSLLAKKIDADATLYIGSLNPGESHNFIGKHNSLARGCYPRLQVMQLTTFPFGLLEKFKFEEVPAALVLTPAVDRPFYAEVREKARRLKVAMDNDREFFSHRPFSMHDTPRSLDWKKSAGRRQEDWVTKVYRSPKADGEIIVKADWLQCKSAKSEKDYERYLTLIQTACTAVNDENLPVVLEMSPWGKIDSIENISRMLAALPFYKDLSKSDIDVPREFTGGAILNKKCGKSRHSMSIEIPASSSFLVGRGAS